MAREGPVLAAHRGEKLEVHYRWHPYFGCRVGVRRVEQRTTGRFLKVQGPTGVVVSIAGWMLDPAVCAGMIIGPPRLMTVVHDTAVHVSPPRRPITMFADSSLLRGIAQ